MYLDHICHNPLTTQVEDVVVQSDESVLCFFDAMLELTELPVPFEFELCVWDMNSTGHKLNLEAFQTRPSSSTYVYSPLVFMIL